jgi:hypothetical protein
MKSANNKKEVYVKRDVIDWLLRERRWTIDELLSRLRAEYGIGLKYTGFSQLLSNQCRWKLLYAYALCDYFNMNLKDLFELRE